MKITSHSTTPQEFQNDLVIEFTRQIASRKGARFKTVRAKTIADAEMRMLESVVSLISSVTFDKT